MNSSNDDNAVGKLIVNAQRPSPAAMRASRERALRSHAAQGAPTVRRGAGVPWVLFTLATAAAIAVSIMIGGSENDPGRKRAFIADDEPAATSGAISEDWLFAVCDATPLDPTDSDEIKFSPDFGKTWHATTVDPQGTQGALRTLDVELTGQMFEDVQVTPVFHALHFVRDPGRVLMQGRFDLYQASVRGAKSLVLNQPARQYLFQFDAQRKRWVKFIELPETMFDWMRVEPYPGKKGQWVIGSPTFDWRMDLTSKELVEGYYDLYAGPSSEGSWECLKMTWSDTKAAELREMIITALERQHMAVEWWLSEHLSMDEASQLKHAVYAEPADASQQAYVLSSMEEWIVPDFSAHYGLYHAAAGPDSLNGAMPLAEFECVYPLAQGDPERHLFINLQVMQKKGRPHLFVAGQYAPASAKMMRGMHADSFVWHSEDGKTWEQLDIRNVVPYEKFPDFVLFAPGGQSWVGMTASVKSE